jgi:single-stranded DNA-binding protein
MAINDVKVQGGLTRDPDTGYGKGSGTAYWRASLAVNGTRYDPQSRSQVVKTTFVSILAFGYKAEQLINDGVGKGDELWVRGEIDQSSYEKDGKTEHKTHVQIQSYDVVRSARARTGAPQQHVQQGPPQDGWSSTEGEPGYDPWATPSTEPPF